MSIFTTEEKSMLRNCIENAWDVIGSDMFVNDEGEFDGSIVFTNYDVAEISLDADRWKIFSPSKDHELIKELISRLYSLDYEEMKKEIDSILPYKAYGY